MGVSRRCGREDRSARAAAAERARPRRTDAGIRGVEGVVVMAAIAPENLAAHGSSRQPETAAPALDVERVRRDFPILSRTINGRPLVYLASAASSQRPLAVLRAVEEYETHSHPNVHPSFLAFIHASTESYEGARERISLYIN